MFNVNEIRENEVKLSEKILHDMYPGYQVKDKVRTQKSLKDIQWTLLFIVEAYQVNNVMLLNNYVRWMKRLFDGLSLDRNSVETLFVSCKNVLKHEYPSSDIDVFLSKVELTEEDIYDDSMESNPFMKDMEDYLDAILHSDRIRASNVIQDLLHRNVSIEDIYLYIFQESMRKVGMLWQDNQISVGREHYCTAVTQFLMSSLYSRIFTDQPKTKKIMACAVGSELHELGIRMVADIFEMNGWDSSFLGSNLPKEEIISFAKQFQPDIIALSITMPYHVSALKETIDSIRSETDLAKIKIMVGGLPFKDNQELYRSIGADAIALDVKQGLEIANEIIQ